MLVLPLAMACAIEMPDVRLLGQTVTAREDGLVVVQDPVADALGGRITMRNYGLIEGTTIGSVTYRYADNALTFADALQAQLKSGASLGRFINTAIGDAIVFEAVQPTGKDHVVLLQDIRGGVCITYLLRTMFAAEYQAKPR